MSSVKIKDIYYDGEVDSCEKVKNIEVVPRKIVEMIIEKCHQDIIKYNHNSEEAACIKQYAESLLKQFEEDDSSNTEENGNE